MTDQISPLHFSDPAPEMTNQREAPAQTQGESPRAAVPPTVQKYNPDTGKLNPEWRAPETSSETVSTNRTAAPTQASKSEVRTQTVDEEEEPQSYVWLPNGEVLLVNDEDLPGVAGNQAQQGHWEKDGKVYTIVAVYPKETTIKEGK
jgi:hypothetical protein